MFNKYTRKKTTISVTDLASYAADKPAFIKYKKHGLTPEQKKYGDDFHQSIHTKRKKLRGSYVVLVFTIITIAVFGFIL